LIEGPSGSGKELFAREIHRLSGRSKGSFVAVNCGALPDTLLESELFGYRKGAFTDARKDKPGRFALAEGGTMLLDEVGDVSAALQVKFLRVLQEREYEPLGATTPVKADVRIIAATNRPLGELVEKGQFRDDLYYRLNVVKIAVPPLSRRREDIPLIADHIVERLNIRTDKRIKGLSNGTLDVLMNHSFPGNVRELENILEHAFILCRGDLIQTSHLPRDLVESNTGTVASSPEERPGALQNAEIREIQHALERFCGNRSKTAAALGIHKTTLWRKMKRYGIDPDDLPTHQDA
jgi:transcriptional regulator with PAS, ATPase and Fis domain